MHADFDLSPDGSVAPARSRSGGHGGARANSGPKPAGYVKPPEGQDYDKAKARNEAAKAGLNELELKIKSNEYLSRTAYREASATLLASASSPGSSTVLTVALFLLGLGWSASYVSASSALSAGLTPHDRPAGQGAADLVMSLTAAAAGALADGLKGGLLAAGGQLVSGGKNLLFGHGHDALL